MSEVLFGQGTLLKMGDAAGTVFTTIARITDLSLPSLSADSVESTSHDSANFTREFEPGLIDPGEISFTILFDPAETTHGLTAGLPYLMKNRLKRSFQILYTDAGDTIWTFTAFVTGFEGQAPIDDNVTADVTLKITGFPVES